MDPESLMAAILLTVLAALVFYIWLKDNFHLYTSKLYGSEEPKVVARWEKELEEVLKYIRNCPPDEQDNAYRRFREFSLSVALHKGYELPPSQEWEDETVKLFDNLWDKVRKTKLTR